MERKSKLHAIQKATVISAVVNTALGIVKIIFGVLGHSQALLADGVHSFSDLITDALVFFAAKYGTRAADEDHPYGHGRIETAATLALSMLLFFAGVAIIWDAIYHFYEHDRTVVPSLSVIGVAFISIIANEGLYRYSLSISKRVRSSMLAANAWHNRSDAYSSLVVLIGVVGSQFGYAYFDDVSAVIVGGMIIYMGWQLAWSSVRELVDTGLAQEALSQIKTIIDKVPGVRHRHQLRTRSMGGSVFVDVHVLIDPMISVSEGHHIGEIIALNLRDGLKSIKDVTVHIDPEDDELDTPSGHLPLREDILKALNAAWADLIGDDVITHIVLHYLSGKVQADVYLLASEHLLNDDRLLERFQSAVTHLTYINFVRLYFAKPL